VLTFLDECVITIAMFGLLQVCRARRFFLSISLGHRVNTVPQVTAWEVHNRAAVPYGSKISSLDAARKVLGGFRLDFGDQGIPEKISDLYARCMLVDPSKRPTFSQCVELIDQFSGEEEIVYAALSKISEASAGTGSSFSDLDTLRSEISTTHDDQEYANYDSEY
jgi:Protein tyrosine and serine/threonine kinase